MKYMPMGPYPIEVALCLTDADWRRSLKDYVFQSSTPKSMPKSEGCVTRFTTEDHCMLLVVTIRKEIKLRDLWARASIVVHEATHVWQDTCEHINEPRSGDEIEACSIQWISNWLFNELDEAGYLNPLVTEEVPT